MQTKKFKQSGSLQKKIKMMRAWSNYCLTFDTAYIDEASHEISRIIAEGHCDKIPLNVKTGYKIISDETRITVTFVFAHSTAQDITI